MAGQAGVERARDLHAGVLVQYFRNVTGLLVAGSFLVAANVAVEHVK
jgi:hypothetical protein